MKKFIVNIVVFIFCFFALDYCIYKFNSIEYKKVTNTDMHPILPYYKFYTERISLSLPVLR